MSTSGERPGGIWLGRGPREVEGAVLDEVLRRLAEARRDPALLARPLRIVVSSRSLREHLAARLLERAGGGVAGIAIQTLHGLALEVLERAGASIRVASSWLPILVREAARDEPALRSRLDHLVDGYGVVRAAVDDLLDAGFEPLHAEAIDDRLEALGATGVSVEVARGVVRVTSRVADELAEYASGHRADVLRRAQEILSADPDALAARGVVVHGFSDATGVAAGLLATLLRRPGSLAVLDRPPEPGAAGEVEAFGSRFRERLATSGAGEVVLDGERSAVELEAVEAPGAAAEVREVGRRIQALLRSGVAAESIGVVARDLGPYGLALRAHFGALAIPFSGLGQTVAGRPGAVRAAAVVALLRSGGACLADRWLDALVISEGAPLADLRLAIRSEGAVRVADVARLHLPEAGLRLPMPLGFESSPGGSGGDGSATPGSERAGRMRMKEVSAEVLSELRDAARRGLEVLGGWPRRQEAAAHFERLASLLGDGLGWDLEDPATAAAVGDAIAPLPSGLSIDREDFCHLVERAVRKEAEFPIGGRGGGVQVLGVMEARARTFAHLFVVGLNRDVFPRPVREDPILGDAIREVLGELLPDIPVKARGHDEERHLFAQLLASAPEVTLSWQSVGDDGKALAPSTFVDRLRWGRDDFTPVTAEPPIVSPAQRRGEVPALRPAFEVALEASLEPGWASLEAVLPAAMEERAAALGAPQGGRDAPLEAKARLAVAFELDRAFGAPDLGPYFGFIGEVSRGDDPRRGPVWMTALENLARCPWQVFLRSILRVEPVVDRAADIPELEPFVLGNVVHGVLEEIYREASAAVNVRLDELGEHTAVDVAWPQPEVLDRLLGSEARKALLTTGLGFAGLEAVAVERVRSLVNRARELAWPGAGEGLAAEATGHVTIALSSTETESIFFRADRVDVRDGHWILSDYKTGARISDRKKEETRNRNWLETVATGRNLQAVAYARARGNPADVGRFLFLDPDLPLEELEYATLGGADDFQKAFEAAALNLLALRRRGAYVPRLVQPGGGGDGDACRSCRLTEACVRGESGARGRLGRWIEDAGEDVGPVSLRATLRALWDPKDAGDWTGEGAAAKREKRR